MRITILVLGCCLTLTCNAKEPRSASGVRDGSSEARAIVVPVPEAKAHDWEREYLKKHFPEHFSLTGPISDMNEEHALIAHEKQSKWFDYYSWTIGRKKTEIYFDISKQVEEFSHDHGKSK
jgi:hypothetical protein